MRGKGNKKEMEIITGKVENSFTNERLTLHSGLGVSFILFCIDIFCIFAKIKKTMTSL